VPELSDEVQVGCALGGDCVWRLELLPEALGVFGAAVCMAEDRENEAREGSTRRGTE
jgi:hypothetical protein